MVNSSKLKAWHFQQGLILPGVSYSIVHVIIIHYYNLQQLITYSITLYKQNISPLEAGKSQEKYQNSLVELTEVLCLILYLCITVLASLRIVKVKAYTALSYFY